MFSTKLAHSPTVYSHEEYTSATEQSSDCLWLTSFLLRIVAALLGAWGSACLINGLINITEMQDLGRALSTAFTGSCLG
jgi:hypothetical protein